MKTTFHREPGVIYLSSREDAATGRPFRSIEDLSLSMKHGISFQSALRDALNGVTSIRPMVMS